LTCNHYCNTYTFEIITIIKQGETMQKYECTVCGYIYDPETGDPDNGVKPGTSFEDIPDEWLCPVCGVGKDSFDPAD